MSFGKILKFKENILNASKQINQSYQKEDLQKKLYGDFVLNSNINLIEEETVTEQKHDDAIFFLDEVSIVEKEEEKELEQNKIVTKNEPSKSLEIKEEKSTRAVQNNHKYQLDNLAAIIANSLDAFTASIFIYEDEILKLSGLHTLSQNFVENCEIKIGSGLIGWSAQNKQVLNVSPFENNSTTLICYQSDEKIRSIIAFPILDSTASEQTKLLGIIYCDSKNPFGFTKKSEKIIGNFSKQIQNAIAQSESTKEKTEKPIEISGFETFIESLLDAQSEDALLTKASRMPGEILDREALVVMTLQAGGIGNGEFYTTSSTENFGHRLIDLVCKHKKIICSSRSVYAVPAYDEKQRSFVSIPFYSLNKEAGSINILSRPHAQYSESTIKTVEKIAKIVGQELERIRLKDRYFTSQETASLSSWRHFSILAKARIQEARQQRKELALLRIELSNIKQIENLAGVEFASRSMQDLMHILEQVKSSESISCYLYGSQLLLLSEQGEVERSKQRLIRLLERSANESQDLNKSTSINPYKLIRQGLVFGLSFYPSDTQGITNESEILQALVETAAKSLEIAHSKKSISQTSHSDNAEHKASIASHEVAQDSEQKKFSWGLK